MLISAKNRGITLIEILLVMTIIALLSVLSTIVVPAQIMRARDAVRKGQLDSLKKSVDEYYSDVGCYPRYIPSCGNSFENGDLVLKDSIPCDPKTKLSYAYVTDLSACPKWFQIYTNLERNDDKIIDQIGCQNGCGPSCEFNYGVASYNQALDPYCTTYAEIPEVDKYVCSPGGDCEIFADPYRSGCPNIYPDDPTCGGGGQCGPAENRCHDSSGKS